MSVKTAYARYLISLLLFGLNGIVASHIALSSCEIVLMRALIGSLPLVAAFALARRPARLPAVKSHALCLAASGVAMGASWMFLYEAYGRLGVGVATLVYYCGPVIVMVAAPLVFRERLRWPTAAGFAAVLAGLALMNGMAGGDGRSAAGLDRWGLFCGVMAALTYALMVIFNRKAASIAGLENAMWQLLAAFVTVAAFVGLRQGLALRIPPASWPPILVLGAINTGLGCYFYFSSIGRLPVRAVAILGYLEPLSAVLFSMLFLQARLTGVQSAGAALILGGAAFGQLFRPARKSGRNADECI